MNKKKKWKDLLEPSERAMISLKEEAFSIKMIIRL